MFRTIIMGGVALVAVLAVLGVVFAVGALRIKIADDGSSVDVAGPTTSPATSQLSVAHPPADAYVAPKPEVVPILTFDSLELPSEKATLSNGLTLQEDKVPPPRTGGRGRRSVGPPDAPPAVHQAIIGWKDEEQVAEWTTTLPKQGVYEVDVVCACLAASGSTLNYAVTVGGQELKSEAIPLRTGRSSNSYNMITVGSATFPAGQVKVRFRLTDRLRAVVLRLRSVRLIPES